MKRIAIIGHTGVVGSALRETALLRGMSVIGLSRSASYPEVAWDAFRDVMPDLPAVNAVCLCAALTNVDLCEQRPDLSRIANLEMPVRIAEWCAARSVPLLFYSSDYVFDGESGPYGEAARTHAINVYGRHKAEAEDAIATILPACHLVVRTTVVFGRERARKNFAVSLYDRLRVGETMKVPFDQYGTPTWGDDLADASLTLLQTGAIGLFHVAGATLLSRAAFAHRAAEAFQLDDRLIIETQTADLAQPARRPLNAGLVSTRLEEAIGRPMLGVDDALARFAAELFRS